MNIEIKETELYNIVIFDNKKGKTIHLWFQNTEEGREELAAHLGKVIMEKLDPFITQSTIFKIKEK